MLFLYPLTEGNVSGAPPHHIETAPIEIYFQGGPYFAWYKDSERIHYTFHA